MKNRKENNHNILCSKCSESGVFNANHDPMAIDFSKIYGTSTNLERITAFGSKNSLITSIECSPTHVDLYLKASETYTIFRLPRKRFPGMKIVRYRLNEI